MSTNLNVTMVYPSFQSWPVQWNIGQVFPKFGAACIQPAVETIGLVAGAVRSEEKFNGQK